MKSESNLGEEMHQWATDLFPICRSLTGAGVRETLNYLSQILPNLNTYQVSSGTQVFDWVVPDEWSISEAYIEDQAGKRIIDFLNNNLHVVGYSEPIDLWLTLDQLSNHLYSLPDQPDAIPYVTSYYSRRWGFCLTDQQRQSLEDGLYHVVINSSLKPGVLNYAELLIPGQSEQEVFLSTYICHPSMANNELSGPVVATALARWLESAHRYYSYRIIFIPETIGSIVYLSRNMAHLKNNVIAGFNITCIGDDRCYSYLPSRAGNTLSDQAALHVLKYIDPSFKHYSRLDRGSDERQYCAPDVDLPIATIMRSKYGEYPEYHTSLDNLQDVVKPAGLAGGFNALKLAIETIENAIYPKINVFCEPQLGKRGLYPTISSKGSANQVKAMMDMISYCEGNYNLLEIANIIDKPIWDLTNILKPLIENGLITIKH